MADCAPQAAGMGGRLALRRGLAHGGRADGGRGDARRSATVGPGAPHGLVQLRRTAKRSTGAQRERRRT
uniref:Uncharacterized protein n=1 Tax=Arundo donax TaxID=35708 RepID=A0A0A9BPE2_ARUDO